MVEEGGKEGWKSLARRGMSSAFGPGMVGRDGVPEDLGD